METESVRQCLNGIGCSPVQIELITASMQANQAGEVKKKLKRLRCDLMEEMHGCQRRIDQLDWLIRNTEK